MGRGGCASIIMMMLVLTLIKISIMMIIILMMMTIITITISSSILLLIIIIIVIIVIIIVIISIISVIVISFLSIIMMMARKTRRVQNNPRRERRTLWCLLGGHVSREPHAGNRRRPEVPARHRFGWRQRLGYVGLFQNVANFCGRGHAEFPVMSSAGGAEGRPPSRLRRAPKRGRGANPAFRQPVQLARKPRGREWLATVATSPS